MPSSKFQIRVVNQNGQGLRGIRITVGGKGILNLYLDSCRTDSDGWAYFTHDWAFTESVTIDITVDGNDEGTYIINDGDTLSFTLETLFG